ncbi:MAG: diaminopimelate decarboxylase [Alphaproteobacteria bacterium]|nr:diaminopimelate decarboxylase [Alphaproteobacteria bacterium]
MIGFEEKGGILHADDVPLTQIATEFGTPAYVYSAGAIRGQYEALALAMQKALPPERQPLLCYACKANSNIAVLSLLKGCGSGLEIVSEGELRRGLKAGFAPEKIVSTGVGKQAREIAACLEAGIHQFNVESLPELVHIQKIAAEMNKTAHVVFRLNPDVTGGGHHKISTGRKRDKFGLGRADVFKGFEMAAEMSHVQAHGLSIHIGSQVFTVDAFRQAFEKLPGMVGELRAAGHVISRLDIGGGFPIIYKDEKLLDLSAYAKWVGDIILPLETEIIMEPGRYLVGNAGVLLSETLYIKETNDRSFLVIDAAMNDLVRPTLYDAYHGIEPVENRDAPKKLYDVVGPICETGDTFSIDRTLPSMKPGALVVIRSAGAYGFCMASNYNTRPMPPEILIDGERVAVIRQRQSYDDLIGPEHIPEWLNR